MKIFHHNDMDGRCAAAIMARRIWGLQYVVTQQGDLVLSAAEKSALKEYGSGNLFVECDYGSHKVDASLVNDGEDVIIVDYSFNEKTYSVLQQIISKAHSVIWIDHHITSVRIVDAHQDELSAITKVVDTSMSAAALCWNFVYRGTRLPYFVQLVSDYDCFHLKLGENTTFFKIGIDMTPNSPGAPIWKDLIHDAEIEQGIDSPYGYEKTMTNTHLPILSNGRIAKKYIEMDNKEQFKNFAFESEIAGVKCIAINRKTNSWVFGSAYNTYPCCVVFAFNGKLWTYSVYSARSDIDCSLIAKKYGGGGHAGAAGFSLTYNLFDSYSVLGEQTESGNSNR